ncbi:MAG: hypothetical protein ACI4PM_07470 [Butyricicoccus sp.]
MKKLKQGLFVALLACLMLFAVPTSAHAASLVQLKTGKTYQSYDVTRDGKKDSIKIVQSASYATDFETKIKVYVNGTKKFTAIGMRDCWIYVFTDGKRSVILSMPVAGDGGRSMNVYNYSNKKFQKKLLTSPGYFYTTPKKSGDYLKVYAEPKGTWWLKSFQNFTDMPFKAVDTYKISGGVLKKVNTYAEISGTKTYYAKYAFTAGKKITTVGAKDGPSVKAGQKVTLKNIYYRKSDGTYYYKISVNGVNGWFKDSTAIQFVS